MSLSLGRLYLQACELFNAQFCYVLGDKIVKHYSSVRKACKDQPRREINADRDGNAFHRLSHQSARHHTCLLNSVFGRSQQSSVDTTPRKTSTPLSHTGTPKGETRRGKGDAAP